MAAYRPSLIIREGRVSYRPSWIDDDAKIQKTAPTVALFCQLLLGFGLFLFGHLFGHFYRALGALHFLAGGDRRFLGHALLEFFHAAGGVNQFLLPCKERVARRTKLNMNFFAGRAGRINLAASANYLRLGEIGGVDVFFHKMIMISKLMIFVNTLKMINKKKPPLDGLRRPRRVTTGQGCKPRAADALCFPPLRLSASRGASTALGPDLPWTSAGLIGLG